MAAKPKERKPNDLFNVIDSVCLKLPVEYDKKEVSSFILTLWLSHDKELMPWVDEVNSILFNVPDKLVYKYFFSKIPKKKRFIKWIKKNKDEKKDKLVEELVNKYGISKKEALQSL